MVLSDRVVVLGAVGAAAGAWWSPQLPALVAVGVVVAAVVVRRPWTAVVAVAVLAAWLGGRAELAANAAVAEGPFTGEVTLVGDPGDASGAVRVEVRAGSRRFDAWARGRAGAAIRPRLAGERLSVRGRMEADVPSWLRHRHVVGRMEITEVIGWRGGDPASRLANRFRRVLERGVEHLAPDTRALFTGFVFGDDRGQSPAVADDFRAVGLTHLLAVSGQNVAFVLAVASPLLARLSLRGRLAATLVLLGFFTLVTRFEPSVLRATTMAAIAALSTTVGRPVSAIRTLAAAVVLLVLVDPFLVHSVGFGLSVGAAAGIILLARPIAGVLPGPRPLRAALAVTLAAQLGVAPILVPVFGGLPVASIPANLLAEPVAGVVMMWGLTAGIVAGLVGGSVATVAHLPTQVGLSWVAAVARQARELPLGELDLPLVAVAATAGALAMLAGREGHTKAARVAAAVVVFAVLVVPALGAHRPPALRTELAGVGELWQVPVPGGRLRVLEVESTASAGRALEALRRNGVRHLDLLISPSGGSRAAALVHQIGRRVGVARIWAPAEHRLAGATTPDPGVLETPGGLRLEVRAVRPRLEVVVSVDPPAAG
ncbi:ComEC/Rec2 family competence protein [Rhabdothermincola sediminis]|uniref:ComEC/Rec2 family competence protein n=1 Tax=Rhabdothermincola sediminis TaxID=2751370 RepID=UPI001AA0759B|nr:ComEC/Rec2 family competence protein [Rhabdothermincola sediminis]